MTSRPRRLLPSLVLLAASAASCSTFEEIHYFRSSDRAGGIGVDAIPNYYRLRISGHAHLSSSRYLSGYFDEETVDQYFNEFSQPTGGRFPAASSSASTASKPAKPESAPKSGVEPLDASKRGRSLVMILSSNCDDVANQLGALESNKEFTQSLAALVAREDFVSADEAEKRLQVENARFDSLKKSLKANLEQLGDASDSKTAVQRVLDILNILASQLGRETPFTDLPDAARWLRDNRSRLLRE